MSRRVKSWPRLWTLALFLLLAALIVAVQFIDIEPWTMQEAIRGKDLSEKVKQEKSESN
jgi:hypothetical protein